MPDRNPGRKNPEPIAPKPVETSVNYNQAKKGTLKGFPQPVTPDGKRLKIHGSQVDGTIFVDADHTMSHAASMKKEDSQRKVEEAQRIREAFGEAAARRFLTLD